MRARSVFTLPDSLPDGELLERLGARFDIAEEPLERSEREAYDTPDRRLRGEGIELWLEQHGGMHRLALAEHGAPPLFATVEPRPRYRLADLPPGRIRDRVGPLIDVRALLPVARVRSRRRLVRVLSGDEKTVARVTVERAGVLAPGRSRPRALEPRVEVAAVRGYEDACERVERTLARDLGLLPSGWELLDEAVLSLGGDPAGIRTKVRVPLEPGGRSDEAAVLVLDALADVVEANHAGTLDDVDPEFLHDLRVAVRRTRSVARQLAPVFPQAPLARHRRDLRWIQQVTGAVRDLDVQLLEWDALVAHLPDATRTELAPVAELLAERREEARRSLVRALRGKRYAQRWGAWREFLAGDLGPDADRPAAATPIRSLAGRRIRKVHRRMVELGKAIDDESPAEALHDLRKKGKELRYLLELFGSLWPEEHTKPLTRSLKELQDVLGRHQDREVQAAQLREIAPEVSARPGGGAALLALGVLVDRLGLEEREARGEFAERFAAFAAKERRREVKEIFR